MTNEIKLVWSINTPYAFDILWKNEKGKFVQTDIMLTTEVCEDIKDRLKLTKKKLSQINNIDTVNKVVDFLVSDVEKLKLDTVSTYEVVENILIAIVNDSVCTYRSMGMYHKFK